MFFKPVSHFIHCLLAMEGMALPYPECIGNALPCICPLGYYFQDPQRPCQPNNDENYNYGIKGGGQPRVDYPNFGGLQPDGTITYIPLAGSGGLPKVPFHNYGIPEGANVNYNHPSLDKTRPDYTDVKRPFPQGGFYQPPSYKSTADRTKFLP